jgi:hypothetical protein
MRRMALKHLLYLTLIFLMVLTSCEGDQGPVGPEGPEGPEGIEGEPGSGIGYTNDPQVGYGWGGDFVEAASVTFDVQEDGTTVFFVATDNVWGTGAACKCAVRMAFDGVADDKTMIMVDIPTATSSNNGASVSTSAMKVLDAGSHTVRLERSGCMTDKHPHINVIVLGN